MTEQTPEPMCECGHAWSAHRFWVRAWMLRFNWLPFACTSFVVNNARTIVRPCTCSERRANRSRSVAR